MKFEPLFFKVIAISGYLGVFFRLKYLHAVVTFYIKGVGEGGQGGGGTCLPTFKSGGGGTSGFVPPPPPHFWAEQMF